MVRPPSADRQFREAKIDDLGIADRAKEDIARLEVADESRRRSWAAWGGACQRFQELGRLLRRHGRAFELIGQPAAIDIFH